MAVILIQNEMIVNLQTGRPMAIERITWAEFPHKPRRKAWLIGPDALDYDGTYGIIAPCVLTGRFWFPADPSEDDGGEIDLEPGIIRTIYSCEVEIARIMGAG